jgi:phosphoribosylformylglycinamidine synthase
MESTLQKEATLEQAIDLGLRADEFDMIKGILGRTPNFTETARYICSDNPNTSNKSFNNICKKI